MPMPTTSPAEIVSGLMVSSVSSTMTGSPQAVPVAAARTNSQRGVMTATPNDTLLGLIRCTRARTATSVSVPLEALALSRTCPSPRQASPAVMRGPIDLESGGHSIDDFEASKVSPPRTPRCTIPRHPVGGSMVRPVSRWFLYASWLCVALSAVTLADTSADWMGDLSPVSPADWTYERAAHLIERAGFGATPEEIERLARLTPEQAVDQLVDYTAIDNSATKAFDESGVWDRGMDPFPPSRADAVRQARERGEALGVRALPEGSPRRLQ